jgi:hypothetical protein
MVGSIIDRRGAIWPPSAVLRTSLLTAEYEAVLI